MKILVGSGFIRQGLIALALLATLPGASACSDVVTNSYATYAEAVTAGAVDRGWMPSGLPPDIHDIREAHDLDTSLRWGLFSFPDKQAAALRALLGPEVSVAGQTCNPPGRIEWWPLLLRGRLDEAQISATGLKTYRPDPGALGPSGRELWFAVNWNQRRAYYWSPG